LSSDYASTRCKSLCDESPLRHQMLQAFSRRYNEEGFLMAQNISAQRQKIGVPITIHSQS
jgi:hypothetical protein